jgi:hypothetical protein
LRHLLRGLGVLVLVAAVTAVCWLGVIAFPEPDRPFDGVKARQILVQVDAGLRRSPIDDRKPDRIFVVDAEWRQRIFFNANYGAGGMNHYPLTRNVFIRTSDIDSDTVFGPSGKPAERPRTLVYFVTHEIGHTLTAERLGPLRFWNFELPVWIREGTADYIGFAGDIDAGKDYARYRTHDPFFDQQSGHYDIYRLLVAYFIKRRGWTMERVLNSNLSLVEAKKIMNADLGHTK